MTPQQAFRILCRCRRDSMRLDLHDPEGRRFFRESDAIGRTMLPLWPLLGDRERRLVGRCSIRLEAVRDDMRAAGITGRLPA